MARRKTPAELREEARRMLAAAQAKNNSGQISERFLQNLNRTMTSDYEGKHPLYRTMASKIGGQRPLYRTMTSKNPGRTPFVSDDDIKKRRSMSDKSEMP